MMTHMSARPAALPAHASSGLGLLQSSKPLSGRGMVGNNFCKNPTKPLPLRRLPSSSDDLVVELTTVREPFAACTLPAQLQLPEELVPLVALDALQPMTLLPRLWQVEECLALLSEEQRRRIASCPAFIGFLERSLEVVCQRGMGPTAPLLLLHLLSMLRFGSNDVLRGAYGSFHAHLAAALEDAAKREPEGLTPQAVLGAYESWAAVDLPVAPLKSSLLALRLRELLRGSKFSPRKCLRLFLALAAIRRRSGGAYSPLNYDVSDLVSGIIHGVRGLGEAELAAAAAACAAFGWPLYRSPVWALDCVAQEAIRRLTIGAMPLAAAERLLGQAVEAAGSILPRLGAELEGRIQQWEVQALAGRATLAAVQAMSSWAEAEEAASALSSVAMSLADQSQVAGVGR